MPRPLLLAALLLGTAPGLWVRLGMEWLLEPVPLSGGLPHWLLTTLGMEWGG